MKSNIISLSFVIVIVLFISSCRKDDFQGSNDGSNNVSIGPGQNTITLQAGNWKKGADYGYYSCDFANVIPSGVSPSCYILYGNSAIPLNNPVKFMNGLLTAEFHNRDISLIFINNTSNSSLPFQSLTIKLDFN